MKIGLETSVPSSYIPEPWDWALASSLTLPGHGIPARLETLKHIALSSTPCEECKVPTSPTHEHPLSLLPWKPKLGCFNIFKLDKDLKQTPNN